MSYKKTIELMDEIRNDMTMILRYTPSIEDVRDFNSAMINFEESIKEEPDRKNRIELKTRMSLGLDGLKEGTLQKELQDKYDFNSKIKKLKETYKAEKEATEKQAEKVNTEIYKRYLGAVAEIGGIIEKFNKENKKDINALKELNHEGRYVHSSKSKFLRDLSIKGIQSVLMCNDMFTKEEDRTLYIDVEVLANNGIDELMFIKENPFNVLMNSIYRIQEDK